MTAKDCQPKPRSLSVAVIVADILMFLSVGLLLITLTGRFPFSGAYASPLGVMKIGPRPTVWVGVLALAVLARITLRREGGRIAGLFTHPTATRLFVLALFIYIANGRQMGAVDTIPSRILPYSILREGNFDLDEFRFLYDHGFPGYLIRSGGHILSQYPPGAAIVALPFYLLPVFSGVPPDSKLLVDVEKLTAAVLAALSVALIFATLRRLDSEKAALTLSLVYAFGTSTLSISSQALWQHGPSQLLLTVSLYCLVRGIEQAKWAAVSGLPLGWAVLCRPTDVLIALPLAAYVLYAHRDQALRFTLFAMPPLTFMAWYNSRYFGSVIHTGYDRAISSTSAWTTPFFEGLSGILVSPSRGLLVYSPVFIFCVFGIFLAWRLSGPLLYKYLAVAVVLVVALYSKWQMWWGGWSFGPRLLADITPLLTLLLVPAFRRIQQGQLLRSGFYTLAGLSIAIHALGAFVPGGWSPDVGETAHRLWSWSDGELMHSGRRLLSKVTGRSYLQDIPGLGIIIDRERYRPGDQVSATLYLQAGKNPIPVDGYLQVFPPVRGMGLVGPMGLSAGPIPAIVSSSSAGRHELPLSFRLPPDSSPGAYTLLALLYKAGSPFTQPGDRRNLLFESQSVTFTISQ
jgi:hypothetical protein